MYKLLTFIFGIIVFALSTSVTHAAVFYGAGVYTNLCGTGLNATANSCQRGCNTNNGTCTASGNNVVKFTCDGRLGECRNNETSFATSQSVAGISCGKTVQIDVFNKTCRVNGNWTCNDQNLVDYMVWYSGDCQAQPTITPVPPTSTIRPTATPYPTATTKPTTTPNPTATPTPTHVANCNELKVIAGNDAYVPANVTLRATGSDNLGTVQKYRFFFGDGKQTESDNPEIQHRYDNSGTFSVRAEIRDSKGNWRTSSACETTVNVKSIPVIESHRSSCSNVFITEGNQTQALTTAKFSVTGYDNKGALSNFKLDFGEGTTQESTSGKFEHRYEKPGTYVIKGYIKDSQGNWKGGDQSCQVSLYVNTQPMKEQPKTGTPTLFTLLGLGSGASSLLFLGIKKRFMA